MPNTTLSPNRTGRSLSSRSADGHAGPFELDVLIASLPSPFHHADVPPQHWQRALAHRLLTPQEQAAREWYFEQRIGEALARFRASRGGGFRFGGRR
jgi:hypothetical protein